MDKKEPSFWEENFEDLMGLAGLALMGILAIVFVKVIVPTYVAPAIDSAGEAVVEKLSSVSDTLEIAANTTDLILKSGAIDMIAEAAIKQKLREDEPLTWTQVMPCFHQGATVTDVHEHKREVDVNVKPPEGDPSVEIADWVSWKAKDGSEHVSRLSLNIIASEPESRAYVSIVDPPSAPKADRLTCEGDMLASLAPKMVEQELAMDEMEFDPAIDPQMLKRAQSHLLDGTESEITERFAWDSAFILWRSLIKCAYAEISTVSFSPENHKVAVETAWLSSDAHTNISNWVHWEDQDGHDWLTRVELDAKRVDGKPQLMGFVEVIGKHEAGSTTQVCSGDHLAHALSQWQINSSQEDTDA